jgi:hypothetical protein
MERLRTRVRHARASLAQENESTPTLTDRDIELAQRGRIILDVAKTDFDICVQRLGSEHSTTWFFRNALDEARRAWERLEYNLGSVALDRALRLPSVAVLTLKNPTSLDDVRLFVIEGRTYAAEWVEGTPLAPVQWRLHHLSSTRENGPYYVCRLSDGTTHCDCGEWIFRGSSPRAGTTTVDLCKHLQAITSLGWFC